MPPRASSPPIKFPSALALPCNCGASCGLGAAGGWGCGIETMAAAIGADLAARLPRQNKKQREGLALLVATALDVRDVNLMELAAALPRAAERLDMRYQWISRLLANPLIDTGAVMAPFAREVLARARAQAHTLVLIIDQSQVNATHQMVMVSLRVGGRAVPLAWRVKETQGSVGFAEQRAALDRVAALLPAGARPVLMGGSLLRLTRPDRVVPGAGLGLAVAAQAGPAGVRGRRRDHAGGMFRAGRASAERHRTHGDPCAHQRCDGP